MTDFPTLSRGVSLNGLSKEKLFDPTYRANFSDGAIFTRSRVYGTIPTLYKIMYNWLTAADVILLTDFEEDIKVGSDEFSWEDEDTSTTWTMRLYATIKYHIEPDEINEVSHWSAQIEMYGTQDA